MSEQAEVEYFCISCGNFSNSEEGLKELCPCPVTIQFKRKVLTRWEKFCEWFWTIDVTFHLATFSAITINMMVMYHLHWGFWQTMLESLCMGFVIGRLFQK